MNIDVWTLLFLENIYTISDYPEHIYLHRVTIWYYPQKLACMYYSVCMSNLLIAVLYLCTNLYINIYIVFIHRK